MGKTVTKQVTFFRCHLCVTSNFSFFSQALAISRISDEDTVEINKDSIIFKFKGPGQKDSILITYTGVIKLAMALPGKNAKHIRVHFADVLLRFHAGDASLMAEIERNRESTNPINVAARQELKRGREGVEEGPEERRTRIRKMEAEVTQMTLNNMKMAEDLYKSMCTNGELDDRARLLFKDQILNTIIFNSPGLITNGDESEITISDVARELKIKLKHGQETQAGRIMARLYREKHDGQDPIKGPRQVDGAVRMVNTYRRKDIDIMEQAIRETVKE